MTGNLGRVASFKVGTSAMETMQVSAYLGETNDPCDFSTSPVAVARVVQGDVGRIWGGFQHICQFERISFRIQEIFHLSKLWTHGSDGRFAQTYSDCLGASMLLLVFPFLL